MSNVSYLPMGQVLTMIPGSDQIQVSGKCLVTNVEIEPFYITRDQFIRWQGGSLIQYVMPHLTINQREFLISGVGTDEGWDNVCEEEEDDMDTY